MANQNASIWTDERIETLKDLWSKGHSCSQIAKMLGRGISRSAVIGKVHRLKLPSRASDGPRALKAAATRRRMASAPKQRTVIAGAAVYHDEPISPKSQAMIETVIETAARAEAIRSDQIVVDVAPPTAGIVTGLPEAVITLRGDVRTASRAQCRFPIGEPGEAKFHFCPRDREGSSVYCAEHQRKAFDGFTPRRRRKAVSSAAYVPRGTGLEKFW